MKNQPYWMYKTATEVKPKSYGVFVWTGNGRYPVDNSIKVYKFEKLAQSKADKLNDSSSDKSPKGGYVVREIID